MAGWVKCERCGKAVPGTIDKCPHCGQPHPGKAALQAKKSSIIGGLIIFGCAGFCGLGWLIGRDSQPDVTTPTFSGPLNYEIIKVERAMPGRPRSALRIHVRTEQLHAKNEIAAQLVAENDHERMIRVFIHAPERVLRENSYYMNPMIAFEWTRSGGLKENFDSRVPPTKAPKEELPRYEVIEEFKILAPRGVAASVLIPSLTPGYGDDKLERLAREIAKHHGYVTLGMYRTREAYEAHNSEPYSRAHPGVLKAGLLGYLDVGVFKSARELLPPD